MLKIEAAFVALYFCFIFNITFIDLFQRNGRIYQVGGRRVEIRSDVLDQLELWNIQDGNLQNPSQNDYPFALAILLSLTSPDDISKNMVSDDVMELITDLLRLRTINNQYRIDATVHAIREYCLNG